ncbi:hypothetical protein [Streptomyces sp. NPDC020681]|uniref:hypothetical protein n=1 Tax=Streptomyces sp. NPDC020681 TaxID=3365083 RepID=UPI003795B7AC
MGNIAQRRGQFIARPAAAVAIALAALLGLAPAAAAETTSGQSTGATVSVLGILADISVSPLNLGEPIQLTVNGNTWGD